MDIKNPLNDYEERKGITICVDDLVELDNDHVAATNYAMKWEGGNKFVTLKIMAAKDKALAGKKKAPSNAPTSITESGVWTNILAVETRGLEPTKWEMGLDEFIVISTGGSTFDSEIDFSDDWCEYCEKSEDSVGISNLEHRWKTL